MPQNPVESDTQWELKKILYVHPSGEWSFAELVHKDKDNEQAVVAYRWNVDNDYAKKEIWFVLPKLLADAFLLQLLPE